MVWCGISANKLYGPFFFEANVNAAVYLQMLQQQFLPAFNAHIPLPQRNNMIFQQDGAPPHFSNIVRAFLNDTFPNRWIERGGPTNWPPRSPDLSPPDYFLWGYLKSKVYSTNFEMLKVLSPGALNIIPVNLNANS